MSENVLTTPDLIVFFGSLVAVLAIGLWASRREETSEDFFLAGRNTAWWGVAGSIFGSNVSANHMVGMMGIGFSVGFAQAHFELGAIVGLMLLCYGFLPVFRRLKVYTLSHYLGARYDERSRLAYSLIMVVLMAVIQMVPALYIGLALGLRPAGRRRRQPGRGDGECGNPRTCQSGPPRRRRRFPLRPRTIPSRSRQAQCEPLLLRLLRHRSGGGLGRLHHLGRVEGRHLDGRDSVGPAAGGRDTLGRTDLWTDWRLGFHDGAGRARGRQDASLSARQPPGAALDGVLTGLMALHCFYWGTNQFIVQRALSARSDLEARWGIIVAGFLKLLIPFFAIGTGVGGFLPVSDPAAGPHHRPGYGFHRAGQAGDPAGHRSGRPDHGRSHRGHSLLHRLHDEFRRHLVAVDVYKRHLNPKAGERQMILAGRLCILFFVVLAALLAIFVLDPNSEENFFLRIVQYGSYLMPGLLVAFLMGMFWRRSTPAAGFATILGGVVYSWLVEFAYNTYHLSHPGVAHYFGQELNFFHRVVLVMLLCAATQAVVSWTGKRDPDKEKLVWTDLTGHSSRDLAKVAIGLLVSIAWFALLGWGVYRETLSPFAAAVLGAAWTLALFWVGMGKARGRPAGVWALAGRLRDDRFWAGVLCASAVFLMYVFF